MLWTMRLHMVGSRSVCLLYLPRLEDVVSMVVPHVSRLVGTASRMCFQHAVVGALLQRDAVGLEVAYLFVILVSFDFVGAD